MWLLSGVGGEGKKSHTNHTASPSAKTTAQGESYVEKPPLVYLNILNISRRNIHCTLMVKRYKFITSYKNYHLKVILFI